MALQGHRFKIDHFESSWGPFALYRRERKWFGDTWCVIERFPTREECAALYEKVKDLPEYLD